MTKYKTEGISTIKADDGCTFIRIADGVDMGDVIFLGKDYSVVPYVDDVAENYEEVFRV